MQLAHYLINFKVNKLEIMVQGVTVSAAAGATAAAASLSLPEPLASGNQGKFGHGIYQVYNRYKKRAKLHFKSPTAERRHQVYTFMIDSPARDIIMVYLVLVYT